MFGTAAIKFSKHSIYLPNYKHHIIIPQFTLKYLGEHTKFLPIQTLEHTY